MNAPRNRISKAWREALTAFCALNRVQFDAPWTASNSVCSASCAFDRAQRIGRLW